MTHGGFVLAAWIIVAVSLGVARTSLGLVAFAAPTLPGRPWVGDLTGG